MALYTKDIRSYMKLFEAERPHEGDPNVSYDEVKTKGEITKVIANLSSFASGKYTRLAKNIARMQRIAQETLAIEAEIKQDGREAIADLFLAEDAAYTRVVETVSFTLQLTKDPKAATTVKYEKVLEELQSHLTPELLAVLESIKAKFSTVQKPKPPSLTHSAKEDGVGYGESINEAPMFDRMKQFFKNYYNKIKNWAQSYDDKLAALKSEAGITESRNSLSESKMDPNNVLALLWESIKHSDNLEPLDDHASGSSMSVRAGDGVFEITVKQVS